MLKQSTLTSLLFALPLLLAAQSQPKIKLENWASGFKSPVDIAHCGDSRLFIVELDGIIWAVDSTGAKIDTFLNIDARVRSGGEQGLLGLDFHPNYAQNGYFFVYYTKNGNGDTQVSRFSVRPDNPNRADPNSELFILGAAQPYSNHNGGCIKFSPVDGYLYIALGDGGSGGDPQGYGQRTNTFLGKILRIDVNNSNDVTPYVVPSDNPFVGQSNYLPEIWSLGWRNPWRFSFDRLTGDMWIGDVGQVTREEVDFEPAGAGGRNYGWRCYEGNVVHNAYKYDLIPCDPQSTYVSPVFDYDNSSKGCSMTGGFIYRGSKYPDLYGIYLNTDYCSGRFWATTHNTNDDTFSTAEIADLANYQYSSFGEDYKGEMYVALVSAGSIQKVTEQCSAFQLVASDIYSPVCKNSLSGWVFLEEPDTTVTYLWSNGRTESSIVYLDPGTYTVTATNSLGCQRVESYVIEAQGPDVPGLFASDILICSGQSITLTATGLSVPNELRWFSQAGIVETTTGTDTTASIVVSESGTYYVQAYDSACTQTSAQVTIESDPTLAPSIYQSGDTLFSQSFCNSCQWLLNNEPISGATGSYYVATGSGDYSLQTTSVNGCVLQSGVITILISETTLPSYVRSFNLSPNPTNGLLELKMELAKAQNFSLSLSDTRQRQIFMQTHRTDKLTLPIDLRALPAGTYFLRVQTESSRFVRKIVRQ